MHNEHARFVYMYVRMHVCTYSRRFHDLLAFNNLLDSALHRLLHSDGLGGLDLFSSTYVRYASE
jgi:hypothetical protein